MRNEWIDHMSTSEAIEAWQRSINDEVDRRMARIEGELRGSVEQEGALPAGSFEAMGHFLKLRDKLFPSFPADPAWRILLTLAQTREGSGKDSVTGIAHGANIPLSTALRYIAAMEVEGIITRVPHPEDKRQVIIQLTAEGRRRLDALAEKWAMRLLLLAAPLTVGVFVLRGHLGF